MYPSLDASYHDYWARGLVKGVWAVPPGREDPQIFRYPFFRAPGYAYSLALIYWVFQPGYTAPRLVQMVIGLLTVLLTYLLGRRWWGRATGLIYAFLFATYWIFIYYEGELVGVSYAVLLSLLLVGSLTRLTKRASFPRGLATGLILGILAMFRSNILLFFPVALLWLFWSLVLRAGARRSVPVFAGVIIGTILALSPATIRNYRVSHEFVLISTNAGQSLAVGNNELSDGATHLIPGLGDVGTPFDWPRMVRRLEKLEGRLLTHSQASSLLARRALDFIRRQPGDFFRLLGRKALLFWGPREIRNIKEIHYARLNSPLLRSIPVNFPLVLALALIGGILLFREIHRRRPRDNPAWRREFEVAILLLLFVGTYFISVLPAAAAARYRVPVIPFLLGFSACGIKTIAGMLFRRAWRPAFFWGGAVLVAFGLFSINLTGYQPAGEKYYYDRALAYVDAMKWDEAIRDFQRAIRIQPKFVRAFNNVGNIYSLRGDYRQAIRYYSYAYRLAPNLAQIPNNIGNALYKQGKLKEAVGYFQEALRLRPDLVEAQNNMGVVLLKLNRPEEAIRYYQKALLYRPSNVATHLNLGNALKNLGRGQEARRHFEAALKYDPGCKAARQALQRLKNKNAAADHESKIIK